MGSCLYSTTQNPFSVAINADDSYIMPDQSGSCKMEDKSMRKIWKTVLFLLIATVSIPLAVIYKNHRESAAPKIFDISSESFTVTEPHVIFFPNLTEVIVDPRESKCDIVYERKAVGPKRRPCAIATVYFAGEKYVISCMKVVNKEIEINGEEYSLRKSNPVISEKKGISWTNGNFRQGPDYSIPNSPRVYPLKGRIPQTVK